MSKKDIAVRQSGRDNSGQLKSEGGAPDFARETGAPKFVKAHESSKAPNTCDPARGKGRQSGDGAKE